MEKESKLTRNPKLIEDDRWKNKGGPIKDKRPTIDFCHVCYGLDSECPKCQGLGEVEKK